MDTIKKSFLFISCEEAHHICDKSQYGEATLWERIKLSIRLSWCKVTRNYTRKNKALTKFIESSETKESLNKNEISAFESRFKNELEKHK